MKTFRTITTSLLLALAATGSLTAASTSELLQQGLYAEEVEGNLNAAIKAYGEIIKNTSAPPRHAAQALYRQALCYLRLKDEGSARAALEKLLAEYPGQTEIVEKARPLLDDLTNFDPATLMPPETLIYLELGNPGRQIETILGMLQGTPFENPLAAISGQPGSPAHKSAGDIVGALLNPSMITEFKKIRSSAIGITGIAQNNPPMVAVLYPGKSDALRGLILAGLGMIGTPAESLEGMQTLKLPEDAMVAYDDKVILAAKPASQLAWCVKQYKGASAEPTLATSNKSFEKLDKNRRQKNVLTLWANVDDVYGQLLSQFPPGQVPQEILSANAICDFANIDELVITDSLETNGLMDRAEIQFKSGHHCVAYDLIRTPNLSRAALEAVPAEAVALVSFALGEAGSVQSDAIREKVRNVTGLDVGREIFSNLEQITIFALPAAGSVGHPELIPGRLGLAITSHNPAQTRQTLGTVLGMISPGQANAKPGQYKLKALGNQDLVCHVEQVNGITLLSLNPEVIAASSAAIRNRKSVCVSGPLSGAVSKLAPTASKLLLANAGGVMRLVGLQVDPAALNAEQSKQLQTSFDELARALDTVSVELGSEEQLNSLALNTAVTGIPPLNQVVGPITQLSRLSSQAQEEARVKSARQEQPATINPAAGAPAIDGQVEELWSAARRYPLQNVIYDQPASPNDLAADYLALWDASNLYLLVDVTDESLRRDTDEWFQSDGVEVYIDALNRKSAEYGEKDYQYAFCWDKTAPRLIELKHNRTNGVQYAFAQTDKGYRVEIKFPWSTLGTKPAAGANIGLDVEINDNDRDNHRESKRTWHDPEDGAWNNPQLFGNAELAGLIGWWKFDETQGTTAADSSGGGHNGALAGNAKWAKGKAGGALDLDGAGSFVRIADKSAFDIGGEVTLASWVNFRAEPVAWAAIVGKGDSAWRLSAVGSERKVRASIGSGSNFTLSTQTTVNVGEWHHVAAVFGSGVLRLYVDGKLEGNQLRTGPMKKNDFEVLIGENSELKGRGFNGLLDDVRVYNHALPEAQIKALAAGQ